MPSRLFVRRLRALRAFTLIELIVVILLIGLLAALATVAYMAISDRSARNAERLEVMSVAREAAVLAAFDSDDVRLDDFQAAFDDLGQAALTPGLAAQQRAIAVITQEEYNDDGAPTDADRYFIYAHQSATGESRAVSAVIGPSRVADDLCIAAAVSVNQVSAEHIDPADHGATGDTIGKLCNSTAVLSWATSGEGAPDPGGPSEDPEEPGEPDEPGEPGGDPAPVAPAVPAAPDATASASTVSLTWGNVEGAAHYDVARDSTDSPHAQGVAPGGDDTTTYVDHVVDEGTEYTYWVRACLDGPDVLCSEWSDPTAVTTEVSPPAVPPAPTGFAFTNATGSSISFTWEPALDAEHYEVARDGAAAPVSTTSTSHTWSGLAASIHPNVNTYDFRVRACNDSGCSPWTADAAMTTAGYWRVDATSVNSAANSSGTARTFQVPAGVKRVFLQAAGAKGANGATCPGRQAAGVGARGANARGALAVNPGDTLSTQIGKQGRGRHGGWPGGGNGTASSMGSSYCTAMGDAGAGGGYTRWDRNGTTVLVAGGGGGGGSANHDYSTTTGGNGGAPGLANGSHGSNGTNGGAGIGGIKPLGGGGGRAGGGTAAGGGADISGEWIRTVGGNGTAWTGGNSGNYGGGGGGGYGGGGAGGALGAPPYGLGWGAGGGGGSSYANGLTGLQITQVTGLDEGRACVSWHGDTTCANGSAPFVP